MKALRASTSINANIQNEVSPSISFHHLCSHDQVYRARIAADLGISAPAVSRAIDGLIEDGFVIEAGKIATGKSKRATELCVNTGGEIVNKIDLIKTPTRIATPDFRGTLIDKRPGFALTESTDVVAAHPELRQVPVQGVSRRSRLVARPPRAGIPELSQGLASARQPARNDGEAANLRVLPGHRHSDGRGMDIEAGKTPNFCDSLPHDRLLGMLLYGTFFRS